ncbi:MAG: amino acid adenylation domain-containing protein [Acidobacteria bacterium]|nr:amino acid adenylation domain-containing protein [Acidobacteriota bacterium]
MRPALALRLAIAGTFGWLLRLRYLRIGGRGVSREDDLRMSLQKQRSIYKLTALRDRPLPAERRFREPYGWLSASMTAAHPVSASPVPPGSHAIGLTDSQRDVWLATQTQPDAALAFNEGVTLSFAGAMDSDALRWAVAQLVQRHDCLRGTVSLDGQRLLVQPFVPFEIPIVSEPGPSGLNAIEAYEMGNRFDLERGPLIRLRIVRESGDWHLLILAHHIVFDDWSVPVLVSDLAALYAARRDGRDALLPPASAFADYVSAEQTFTTSTEGAEHTAYWLQRLEAAPLPVELPMDLPRPARRTYGANTIQRTIDADVADRLALLAGEREIATVVLAGLVAQLYRVTGSTDLVVGLTAPGQVFHRQEGLVGHCIHFLPVRFRLSGEDTFVGLVDAVDRTVREALDHQGITFGSLLPQLKIKHDPLRPPLASIAFNAEAHDLDAKLFGAHASCRRLPRRCDLFDVSLTLVSRNVGLAFDCSYNPDLFTQSMVEARLEEFEDLLRSAASNPSQSLDQVGLLSDRRRSETIQRWNDTARAYPLESTLPELLHAAVARWPDRAAVVTEQAELSYRQLDERADIVASHLRRHGVGPDVLVGVCAYRSIEMVVALLGILKAGGAYLPLDPDDPVERLAFMVDDSQCRLLLAGNDLGTIVSTWLDQLDRTVLLVDSLRQMVAGDSGESSPTADSLAYVIFTSGSTGRPKGTMLTHRGIVNRLLWGQEHYSIGPGDRILQKTPFTFDVSVPEFFWPLINGATLVMALPGGHKDPEYLVEVIQREEVTVCHFVPSMMGPFLDHPRSADCQTLRHVFASGEAFPYSLTRRFHDRLPRARLHNLYGPTEASVEVSYWECPIAGDSRGLVPIGRPVANTQLHVLDAKGQPVPVGVSGELHVGGVQLARGYLNRDALTAQQFVEHPEYGRLYRTGDLARWLPDGVVDFLGRADRQVKLRGFRIELGEIEEQLRALPQIAEAVVGVRERAPGDPRLVAWVRPVRDAALVSRDIGQSLASRLPGYMIPQVFVEVSDLPHLSSGKIDRNGLPDPFGAVPADPAERRGPETQQELSLAQLWQELLGVDGVGPQDRFADLGGHSLLALKLVASLEQQYGIRLPLRAVMMESLAVLARQLPGSDRLAPSHAGRHRAETNTAAQEVFFFGEPDRHLFGALTTPGVRPKRTGILVCPSWGVEYMRAYRGLNRLSERLAEHGYAVLRFDYASTGDSAGDSADARVEEWLENIAAADAELRHRTGVRDVCLVGLRLGALLAQRAVGRGLRVSHLVLWDPPPNGASWLDNLRGFDHDYHRTLNGQRPPHLKLPSPPSRQLLGMPLPDHLRVAIEGLTLAPAPKGVEQLVTLSSDSAPGLANDAVCLPNQGEWSVLSRMTTPWNPASSINLVADTLGERLP